MCGTWEVIEVPGALEVPTAIGIADRRSNFDGYVALGCVVRGETTHYETVCNDSSRALQLLGLQGLCIGNGILTVENEAQAIVRADPAQKDKGGEAAKAALALLDIAARCRKQQIALAEKFGLSDYPAPAGGCLLTDVGYSKRLKDLFDHQDECTEAQLHLLKYGRHFRLNSGTKLIVGRTQEDNERILKYHDPQTDTVIDVKDYPSPLGLVPGGGKKDVIYLASSICVGYSKASNLTLIDVVVKTPQGSETIQVIGIPTADFKKLLI